MKKTFNLEHDKIKPARMVEAVKHEVKKYLKRERNKKLPNDVDFWDFDCKFGATEADAEEVHVSTLNQKISEAEAQQQKSFYIEILAKPGHRRFVERSPLADALDDESSVDPQQDADD